jgi:hypothetical protein
VSASHWFASFLVAKMIKTHTRQLRLPSI